MAEIRPLRAIHYATGVPHRQIAAQPNNRQLHEQRAALLEQVGLAEAAAFDRGAAR